MVEFAFTLKDGSRVTATTVRVMVAGEALEIRGEDVDGIELIRDGRVTLSSAEQARPDVRRARDEC